MTQMLWDLEVANKEISQLMEQNEGLKECLVSSQA